MNVTMIDVFSTGWVGQGKRQFEVLDSKASMSPLINCDLSLIN